MFIVIPSPPQRERDPFLKDNFSKLREEIFGVFYLTVILVWCTLKIHVI